MNPLDLSFEDIKVGDTTSFTHVFTQADVTAFAKLTGDENPLHTDEAYAATTSFEKPIVHGMLAGSLFSTLLGMHLPGKRCLYLSQTLTFRKPIFADEELTVSGRVNQKTDALKLLEMSMVITRDSDAVVDGIARVQVLS